MKTKDSHTYGKGARTTGLRGLRNWGLSLGLAVVIATGSVARAEYYTDIISGGLGEIPNTYGPNDDGWFGPYLLGFNIDYFGSTYRSFIINNNGTISFGTAGFFNYTPSDIRTMTFAPTIAPYWADVDTRWGPGSVYVRTDIPDQVIITWDQVSSYYGADNLERTASFQLVIRGPGYEVPEGEGNIGFFYKEVEWETGDASGGFEGFGGNRAVVGVGDGLAEINDGEFLLEGSGESGISTRVQNSHLWLTYDFGDGNPTLGQTESNPFIPDAHLPSWEGGESEFIFVEVPSGAWFDPPTAYGFEYTMTSDSLFTQILGFPTGFADAFTVSVGGVVLGQFGPGDVVDFEALYGSAVASFTITGIDPLVDPDDPLAFPLQLAFDNPTASFSMTPLNAVPEPEEWGTLLVGMLGMVMLLRRRRILGNR